MIFNLFSTGRLPAEKINRKTYYIVTFHLSSCVVYAENFQNKYFQHTQKYIRFTGQSVLVNGKLTPEGRICFVVCVCGGGGGRGES